MTRTFAALLALLAGAAQAEVSGASERRMFVEVKLGSYLPLVDRSFTGQVGPYQTVFQNAPMLMGELELDYEVFQKIGTLSFGLGAGYAEKYGRAKAVTNSSGVTTMLTEAQQQAQSTGIKVVPIKALAIYRFDWLLQTFDVPLVPFVKAGLVVMPWFITNGPSIEIAEGLRGEGVKLGFAGTLGLALCLDFLDKRLARDFDTSMGVNHTYLFGEVTLQEVFDVVATGPDFSSRHWMFGLGLEF